MVPDPRHRAEARHTFCRLCEVMCGLTVTVEDGAITKVRADADHPVSRGFAMLRQMWVVGTVDFNTGGPPGCVFTPDGYVFQVP